LALVALTDVLEFFSSPALPKKSVNPHSQVAAESNHQPHGASLAQNRKKKQELENVVSEGLQTLKKRQQPNGGFGMWTTPPAKYAFPSQQIMRRRRRANEELF